MNEWDVAAAQMAKRHGFSARTDYHHDYDQMRTTTDLAQQILRLARNTLLINLRFMESALVRFVPGDETLTAELATDGHFLYYNSTHICRCFQRSRQRPTRDYLHLTLHCVFRHLFVGPKVNKDLWDLACDIAVENLINEMDIKSLYDERREKQDWLIDKLRDELPRLTAERIYRWLKDQDLPPQEVSRIRSYFYADDHGMWYNEPEKSSGQGDSDERDTDPRADEGEQEQESGAGQDEEMAPEDGEGEESNASGGEFTGEKRDSGDGEGLPGRENKNLDDKPSLTPEETQRMWREIAERIEVDLETLSNSWGQDSGNFIQALREVNREKVDYGAFLRRFAVLGENVEVNDEEFDYIFYTYGMELNPGMPLIEPLEYKEVYRVREFVIALDTSESVAGELVQSFVTKTWNLLKQQENFFTHINVHILQCGSRVEEDARISSQDEFDEYMKTMALKGLGGTDFRPVFDYVDGLVRQHEFTNFKGLIYFTDGYGTFPAMPPSYDAAFVFLDQGREIPEVPVWAIKLLLTEQDIEELPAEARVTL